jgi:putative Mg2+ transporter-C (MgtC) family protein
VPDIPALGWDGALLRLAVAALLGGAIGLERELDEKAAGLRTHILVAVGSALFTLVSAYGFHDFLTRGGAVVRADPSRIAAQIVTGIGFLGAGVIFRQGATVRGLTTAASLWVAAAVGMAAGAGFWEGAVIAAGVALISLRPLEWVKEHMLPTRIRDRLVVDLDEGASAAPVLAELERLGRVGALRREGIRLEVEFDIERGRRTEALADVADLPQVVAAQWSR